MSTVKLKLTARCEAAGRAENEDNFLVSDNLTKENWGFSNNKEISLGKNGTLLVVCDGMGGMNAGEVASDIAVKTIQQWFSNDELNSVVSSSSSIKKYIERAIIAADATIKEDSRSNSEHEGMGSTIVLAWIVGGKAYIGWCGDSRAYRYNTADGLVHLSKDHSYVQELIDAGKLSDELAFDHPQNNIITRSLGDPTHTARPDIREYDLRNGDIILLCSDGLSGVLRDGEIAEVIANNIENLEECRNALWDAARAAHWHDNVTTALCQVISGAKNAEAGAGGGFVEQKAGKNKWLIAGLAVVIVVLLGVIGWLVAGKNLFKSDKTVTELRTVLEKYKSDDLSQINWNNWKNDSIKIDSLINKKLTKTLKDEYINKFGKVKSAVAEQKEKFEKLKAELKNLLSQKPNDQEVKQMLEKLSKNEVSPADLQEFMQKHNPQSVSEKTGKEANKKDDKQVNGNKGNLIGTIHITENTIVFTVVNSSATAMAILQELNNKLDTIVITSDYWVGFVRDHTGAGKEFIIPEGQQLSYISKENTVLTIAKPAKSKPATKPTTKPVIPEGMNPVPTTPTPSGGGINQMPNQTNQTKED
ncbi:MAG: protein phosphatase 2C domain-containing protein [Prevotellaceae bacterium]|jgi:protein phosphatase|nr:protein phosphatase 2C domain-containing protein [Prevotellaceae bacterium]